MKCNGESVGACKKECGDGEGAKSRMLNLPSNQTQLSTRRSKSHIHSFYPRQSDKASSPTRKSREVTKSSTVRWQARRIALAQTAGTVLAMTRIRGNIPSFSSSPSAPPPQDPQQQQQHQHQHQHQHHHSTLISRGLISPTKTTKDHFLGKQQRPEVAKRIHPLTMASSSSSTPLL
jgi:hypothetical protein